MTLAVLIIFVILFIYTLFSSKKKADNKRKRFMECAVGSKAPSKPAQSPPMPSQQPTVAPVQQKIAPEQMQEHMTDIGHPGYDDYKQFIIGTGLEPSVVDSHRAFAKEINTSTSGASSATVTSHDDSVVTRWGLRRATAYVPVSPNAREVPSSTEQQLKDNARKDLSGLL
jgi:hypothetical protein